MIKEAVQKALTAGAGPALAPTSRTGGEALTKESLESKIKNIQKKDKKSQKRVLKSILKRMCELYPEEDPKDLLKVIASKLKNIEGEENV
jgi:hypothetical protein